jgi:hypothetical protein
MLAITTTAMYEPSRDNHTPMSIVEISSESNMLDDIRHKSKDGGMDTQIDDDDFPDITNRIIPRLSHKKNPLMRITKRDLQQNVVITTDRGSYELVVSW